MFGAGIDISSLMFVSCEAIRLVSLILPSLNPAILVSKKHRYGIQRCHLRLPGKLSVK